MEKLYLMDIIITLISLLVKNKSIISKSRWLQHATGPETVRAAESCFSHVVTQALVPPAVDEWAEETGYEDKTEVVEEVEFTRRPVGI